MIISVEKLKGILPSAQNKSDEELELMLSALETFIRKYTNNNFQLRSFRTIGSIRGGELLFDKTLFREGESFEISNSLYNNGVYVVGDSHDFYDEEDVMITKVVYPQAVISGVVNLIQWDIEHRGKIGVKSESLSRYSVTYYDLESGGNSIGGYPKGLMGFLKPYMKAQF